MQNCTFQAPFVHLPLFLGVCCAAVVTEREYMIVDLAARDVPLQRHHERIVMGLLRAVDQHGQALEHRAMLMRQVIHAFNARNSSF